MPNSKEVSTKLYESLQSSKILKVRIKILLRRFTQSRLLSSRWNNTTFLNKIFEEKKQI